MSMSATNTGKKAVHVKWAGKTIALGTFPTSEADEKCLKAKALTRAWRSSMRPKPSREWVMLELERLGVRVVSGRLGRKADDDEGSPEKKMDPGGPQDDRRNSMGWGTNAGEIDHMMARRNSSLALAMVGDRRGSLGSFGQMPGLDSGDPMIPPHRPLVGGGAAAAYEAKRHDHFAGKAAEQQQRRSSLGGLSSMGSMNVNPNQHYEMLKLHHMNLLNEIQETTLMMNLYQQQQLQQQQQQLQQQANAEMGSPDGKMGMMNVMNDPMFDPNQRPSLGLGSMGQGGGNFNPQQMQMMQQGQATGTGQGSGMGSTQEAGDSEKKVDKRLSDLKEDIAQQKQGEEEKPAEATGKDEEKKRDASDIKEEEEAESKKRQKKEDDADEQKEDDENDEEEEDTEEV